ncbi:hypothetical protein [Oribacterium sp. FC2011]|uniref:hypothetical protein n=1 Tax=Oribacterium sp. FC2011 TaxID=1408311 RepID=UPI0004E26BC6|nr:hypothetical protein [Oribacterium sp. FC2011]
MTRLLYRGASFVNGLTNGKTYEVEDMNQFCVSVIDDSGKQHFYSKVNPCKFGSIGMKGSWSEVTK